MPVTEEELERLREQAREWRQRLEVINGRSARLRAIIMRALERIEQERPLTEMEERLRGGNNHPNQENIPPLNENAPPGK